MDQQPLINIEGVGKTFPNGKGGAFTALRDVNLKLSPSEFISFLGPSGCGKTTLLKIIDGILTPDQGRITIGGRPISRALRNIGYVFQDAGLLPWRDVLGNVALGLESGKVQRNEARRMAMEYVRLVDLERFAHYYPHQLSGGMQQRVGLARALAISPQVLLMDEPFGALDAMTRETLQVELARLWEQYRVTVIFVTHDVDEAIFLSDRIALFGTNPGHVKAVVSVDLPRPRTPGSARGNPAARELRDSLMALLHGEGQKEEVR